MYQIHSVDCSRRRGGKRILGNIESTSTGEEYNDNQKETLNKWVFRLLY